jgi:hypothetical protein
MRRVIGIAVIASAAGLAVRYMAGRRDVVAWEGNGHSRDENRMAMLRARIVAARRRVRDEFDSVRGGE